MPKQLSLLDEVLEITDRITVLRDGHVIGTIMTEDATPSNLAQMMVGRPVYSDRKQRRPLETKQEMLVIEDLCCNDDRDIPALKNLNLTVYAGEIVGVAGISGNGQKELAESIAGLRQKVKGTIRIHNKPVTGVIRDTSLLGYIPEDKHKTGLVVNFSVEENMILKTFDTLPYTRWGLLQGDAVRRASQQLVLDGLDSAIERLPDVALRQYERAIQVDPTNPYGYLAIARHHIDANDPRRALPFLDQAEALLRAQGAYSPAIEAHVVGLRGAALYAMGEPEQGFPMLQRASQLAPSVWADGHLSAAELR